MVVSWGILGSNFLFAWFALTSRVAIQQAMVTKLGGAVSPMFVAYISRSIYFCLVMIYRW